MAIKTFDLVELQRADEVLVVPFLVPIKYINNVLITDFVLVRLH